MTVVHVVASQASFTHYCMTKKKCGKREIVVQTKLSVANSVLFFESEITVFLRHFLTFTPVTLL
jgi:hypothetical protein